MDKNNYYCEQLSFKFEGDTSIEADLLLNSLTNLIYAYKATIRTCYTKDEEVEIRINSFSPGSFNVILDTLIQYAPAVAGYIPEVASCAKTFLEMVKIKRELKGRKPKAISTEGDTTKIVNFEGEVHFHNCTISTNYFQNPVIDHSLSNAFGILGASQRAGISVSNSDEAIQISQAECEQLKEPLLDDEIPPTYQEVSNTVSALLQIKTPDLLGNSKWSFMYEGRVIHATVADEEFNSLVKNGDIAFGAGMYLPVDMLIEVKLNDQLEVVHRNYIITHVTGDILTRDDFEGQQIVLEDLI